MMTELRIVGFKLFKDVSLKLQPLTILAGLNSSGKSTVLDAIRICRDGKLPDGHGGHGELVSTQSADRKIIVEVAGEHLSGKMCVTREGMEHKQQLGAHCSFITADRFGPATTLPIRPEDSTEKNDVGEHGEYTAELLEQHPQLAGLPVALRGPGMEENSGVRVNVNAWMSLVSPGFTVQSHSLEKTDLGRLSFSNRRPRNVGFGLSYTLPIFVQACFFAAKIAAGGNDHAVLLVENPEAHLHPRGQTAMGRFFAAAAACGVQCIVETHSDHFFNGVRIAVKEGDIPPESVICHYFEYDSVEEMSRTTTISMDAHGGCDTWPNGFFDETEVNLLKLV